jgi:hypothetical protein
MCTGCWGCCLQHSSGYYLHSPNLCHGWLWVEGRQVLLLPVLSLCMLHLLFTVWSNVDCMHPITNVGKYSCFVQPHWLEHFRWIPYTPTGKHISDLTPRHRHMVLAMSWAPARCLKILSLLQSIPVWWRRFFWTDPVPWTITISQFGDMDRRVNVPGSATGIVVKDFLRESGLQARFRRIRHSRAFRLYHLVRPTLHLRHEGLELPETVEGDQNVCVWLRVLWVKFVIFSFLLNSLK